MPTVLNKVEMKASPKETYRASTTLEGLSGLAGPPTRKVTAMSAESSSSCFGKGGMDMKVLELQPRSVCYGRWSKAPRILGIGTEVSFDLRRDGDFTGCPVQAPGLEGAGRVHVPLHHEVGALSNEHEVARRNPQGAPFPDDVHIGKPKLSDVAVGKRISS